MYVFVYGTLTDPGRARQVLDDFAFRGAAVLEGLHRVTGTYPTLAPGGRVEGRILTTPEDSRLDRYEGVERGLYVRVAVPLVEGSDSSGETDRSNAAERGDESDETNGASESETVAVYVGDPAALGVREEVKWPGEGTFPARVERYVREERIQVRRV